jgi:hypothetical protein
MRTTQRWRHPIAPVTPPRSFAGREFTRADYLRLHPQLSAPTASRDLQQGVAERLLTRRGDRRTARYRAR